MTKNNQWSGATLHNNVLKYPSINTNMCVTSTEAMTKD